MASLSETLLAGLAALWLAIAFVATWIGFRRASAGARATRDAQALADLLAAAPVLAVLVHANGAIDADPRLAAWLGLGDAPTRLADLGTAQGLPGGQMAVLEAAIDETRATGVPLSVNLTLEGGRFLRWQGRPYEGPGATARAVLLWIVDLSQTQEQIEGLTQEGARLGTALEGLSALIEGVPFPIWHRAPDLSLSLVNSAYVRAVEADDAQQVVTRGLELIEAGPEASAGSAQQRGAIVSRTAAANLGGQRRMMRVVDVPLGGAGVAGYAIDVQELEDARQELAQFVRAQRDMLDRVSAGVAQFAADRSLVFSNRHFARLFAIEPEWLADRPEFDRVLEQMRETQRAPESRDFPGWKAERRGWFATTEPIEESWLLPGGMHLRVVAQPLPDRGLMLIFEDRTEHLQLASARDTLLRVRTATFENLFEALGVFAADGRLHLWNNRFREMWDLSEADLASHPRVDVLVQSIAPKLLDPSKAGLIRDLVRIATVERQHRSGRISLINGHHYEFAAVPLPDGNALFTLLDITASRGIEEALRDRNEALEEANSLKNAFVAGMSYELRVPLTSIAGFAEMLQAGYAGELPEQARDYVGAINTAVGRLSSLIGDALDLTQSEAGSLPIALAPIDLAELVRRTLSLAAEPAKTAGLILAGDIADSGVVSGDGRRLTQVLDNLLRNALAYTPPGGRVLVRSRVVEEYAEVVVSDNGPGIPSRERERIFDRLRGGSIDAADPSGPPAGIGLPLARQLVEAHGGELTLLSEVGRGTSVIMRLPLLHAEAQNAA